MVVQKIKSFFESVRNVLAFLHSKENCEYCTRYEQSIASVKKVNLHITVVDHGLEKLDEWMALTGIESYTKFIRLIWAVSGWIIQEQNQNRVILSVSREVLEKIYAATNDDEVTELVSYMKNIEATPSPETAFEKPEEEAREQ